MSLLIRRGLDSERLTITPAEGEFIYTTDNKELFIGDGVTVGGNPISGGSMIESDPLFSAWLAGPPNLSEFNNDLGFSSITPAILSRTNDTNVTLTLTGLPNIALLQNVNIAVGWTGLLADSRIASASTWNSKQNAITTGTTFEYLRGDLSLATFPTNISTFTNDSGYITSSTANSTYVPLTRQLTINGVSFDLSANRSWTVGDILSSGSYLNPSWITGLAWSKITSTPTTLVGYNITDAQPLDSDLTAIAALTTDSFGRDLLTKTTAASVRSYIGAGVGDALTSGNLSQFASTTSAQIAALISDETGSGALVFGTSPTLITPVIAKISNLNTNGFIKTTSGDGTLVIDSNNYKIGGSVDLNSDVTTSNTTFTNTNLVFSAEANKTYNVKIWGHCAKATSNSGLKIGVLAPTGATVNGTEFRGGAVYSTGLSNGEISSINTLGGTFATGIGVKVPFRLEFTIKISSTAGNVGLGFATVTSNVATIYAGTNMEWTESNSV